MCLETFDAESAIVDIVNGTSESYVAVFKDVSGREFPQPIEAHDSVPIRLSRALYQFALYRNNVSVLNRTVDLRASTFDWQVLGAPDARQVGRALESAATAAASVAVEKEDVQSTLKLAYTAYMIGRDMPAAERVSERLGAGSLAAWTGGMTDVAAQEAVTIPQGATLSELKTIAAELQHSGNLKASGDVLVEAAQRSKHSDKAEAMSIVKDAYLTLNAAGAFEAARALRTTFKLPVQSVCPQCKDFESAAIDGDLAVRQVLGNLTMLKLLKEIGTAEKTHTAAAAAKK